jgi:Zn-dependent metalloprotease
LQLGGKDPQPATYKDIATFKAANAARVRSDRGGVHLFSGVPNRAFVICAQKFGGYSWEKAGQIWWITITTHRIPPNCTFLQFADATVAVTQEKYGDADAKIVRAAWNEVGVVRTI